MRRADSQAGNTDGVISVGDVSTTVAEIDALSKQLALVGLSDKGSMMEVKQKKEVHSIGYGRPLVKFEPEIDL